VLSVVACAPHRRTARFSAWNGVIGVDPTSLVPGTGPLCRTAGVDETHGRGRRLRAEFVRFRVGVPETGDTGIRETRAGVLETGRRAAAASIGRRGSVWAPPSGETAHKRPAAARPARLEAPRAGGRALGVGRRQGRRGVLDGIFGQARHGDSQSVVLHTTSRTPRGRTPGEPAWRGRARSDCIQAPRRARPDGRLAGSESRGLPGALPAKAAAARPRTAAKSGGKARLGIARNPGPGPVRRTRPVLSGLRPSAAGMDTHRLTEVVRSRSPCQGDRMPSTIEQGSVILH
jgi:hypothetical protein